MKNRLVYLTPFTFLEWSSFHYAYSSPSLWAILSCIGCLCIFNSQVSVCFNKEIWVLKYYFLSNPWSWTKCWFIHSLRCRWNSRSYYSWSGFRLFRNACYDLYYHVILGGTNSNILIKYSIKFFINFIYSYFYTINSDRCL